MPRDRHRKTAEIPILCCHKRSMSRKSRAKTHEKTADNFAMIFKYQLSESESPTFVASFAVCKIRRTERPRIVVTRCTAPGTTPRKVHCSYWCRHLAASPARGEYHVTRIAIHPTRVLRMIEIHIESLCPVSSSRRASQLMTYIASADITFPDLLVRCVALEAGSVA
jgi:hypothetical protein